MFAQLFERFGSLPVAEIASGVAESVLGGTVTIVASATGSGKTLLLPASLADVSDEQIVVLVPRRFLAVNAAETVAKFACLTVGGEVGYAVGAQSGEASHWTQQTKVFYCTYGYAIASGLINRANKIALDEVHETSLDISICRALLHLRLTNGEKLHILEMSATINAQRQAAYWQKVAPAKVIEIDGRTFPCVRRHQPASPIEQVVKDLIDVGRRGILVFRPGRGEVEDTAAAIRALLGDEVEVAEIYGELDYQSRNKAVAAPTGKAKVLVGTNVVESGVNIAWLDAGVTCGTGKELSVRPETGATFLGLIDLPRWRLEQQEGRVKRFRDGIFVLCAEKSFEQREAETTPEIKRLALTELVMHCAAFGLRADKLTFDYPPEKARIIEAETKLQRLGLIDADCRLTKAGQWVANMPVGPETGAMLWHAKQTGVLGAALPLAAVIEVNGIRKDSREPHSLNSESDWLDALAAFNMVYAESDKLARKRVMERGNVSYKRFEAAKELLHDLRRRFNGDASSTPSATLQQLKLCLVAGFAMNLFKGTRILTAVMSDRVGSYNAGNGSAVFLDGEFALGQLRTIQPRDTNKRAFTIVEHITNVSLEDIVEVAKVKPSILTIDVRKEKTNLHRHQFIKCTSFKLFGEFMLGESKVMALYSTEEVAEMAAFEVQREAFISRLRKLSGPRQRLGLSQMHFEEETFGLSWFGRTYSYTEEEVTLAEQDNAEIMAAKKETMLGITQATPSAGSSSSPFDRLKDLVKR